MRVRLGGGGVRIGSLPKVRAPKWMSASAVAPDGQAGFGKCASFHFVPARATHLFVSGADLSGRNAHFRKFRPGSAPQRIEIEVSACIF
jgi:hypothetical protein